MDILAKKVTDHCYTCTSLRNIPSTFHQQTTSVPGNIIGCKYSADVARRFSQFILLIREDITSYTDGTLISNEKADSLRNGLLLLMSRLRSQHGPRATIRTDPATSLRTLLNDRSLDKYNVQVELGEPKNINKNPIAESAIRELHSELLRLQPHGGKISETTLAQAICNINSLVRHHKLSATEAWTKRDKLTGDPLNIEDAELIKLKYSQRCNNHEASAKHKARGKIASPFPNINVGQLVYLYSDGSKLQSREKYLVTAVDDDTVLVQKFTKDQFRNRQYRVKRSDLIILPIDYSNKPTTQFDDLFTEAYEKTLPVKPTLSQQSTNVGNPIQPLYHHPTQWLTSDEDSDDDDDEYDDCLSKYFLPNLPPTDAEMPIDNEDIDVPFPEERPHRNVNPPQYLDDYITDLSAMIDDSQIDIEINDTLEISEEVYENNEEANDSTDSTNELDDPASVNLPRRSERVKTLLSTRASSAERKPSE